MTLDFEDGVALLRFNHPEVMNAIGADMLEGWAQAVTEIQRPTNGARCLVLTGVGRGFCAGANLADDKPTENRPRAAGSGLRNTYHPLLLTLRDLEMPNEAIIGSIVRGSEVIVPRGEDHIEPGDHLLVCSTGISAEQVRRTAESGRHGG